MYTLATLHQLRRRLGLASSDTADDDRLRVALEAATAHIERIAGRTFVPRVATLEHTVLDANELVLDDDLLDLTSLTNGDGSSINLSDVIRFPNGNESSGILRLTGNSVFVWQTTPLHAIQVTGVWGWHDRWSQAWRGSGDTVQDNPLSMTATTLTVTDADGLDADGATPRFQVGHLLRIESEYVRVIAVDTVNNQLTIERGVNGTTAASHVQNSAIDIFQPARDVQMLTLRWAAWLYRAPDIDDTGGIPADFIAAAASLRRVRVQS
ncbi:MAG: hypothetical protein D6737_03395 [Chloroflexi bacterium]|nr:MAG: hypothetical protein D6737_03395 [Chloroflexota bacterium]